MSVPATWNVTLLPKLILVESQPKPNPLKPENLPNTLQIGRRTEIWVKNSGSQSSIKYFEHILHHVHMLKIKYTNIV